MQTNPFYVFRPKNVRFWFGNRMFLGRKPYVFDTKNIECIYLERATNLTKGTLIPIYINKIVEKFARVFLFFCMSKVVINSYEEFERLLGQQIGVSDWLEVTQERINQFADATLDHQWIHVDVERAKVESPFKSTIVHGYLTLSLLPYFWNQIIEVNNLKMMVNYGMDKMRFGQAVLSGQRIRMTAELHSLVNLRGTAKAEIKFFIEIEGQKKKALEGIATFLYYFI